MNKLINIQAFRTLLVLLLIISISSCKIKNNSQNCKEIFKNSETYFSNNEFFNASQGYQSFINCPPIDDYSLFISYGKLFICLHRMKDKNAHQAYDSALTHIPKQKDKVVEDLLFRLKSIELQENEEYLKAIDLNP